MSFGQMVAPLGHLALLVLGMFGFSKCVLHSGKY